MSQRRQYGIPPGHMDGMPLEPVTSHTISPIESPRDLPWPPRLTHTSSGDDISPPSHHYDSTITAGSNSQNLPRDGAWQPYRDDDHFADSHSGTPYAETPGMNYDEPSRAPPYMAPPFHQHGQSQSSIAPLVQPRAAGSPSRSGPYQSTGSPSIHRHSQNSLGMADFESRMPRASSYYHGDGYDDVDPWDIADDGDDDLNEHPRPRGSRMGTATAAAAAGGAGAGAATGIFNSFGPRNASGNYGPVANGQQSLEKSEWLRKQSSGSKRFRWIVGALLALVVVGAIVGGVVGGVLTHKSSDNSSSSSGSSSSHDGSLYDLHSSEVQDVMNNANLHKVFPGMDYTPLNAQYPDCLNNPPDQNNITLDVAVMSQLTPSIRLYGTDCNQTEMVLEAISRLDMNDTMKVWVGVYLDKNTTTNARQLEQMYNIFAKYPTDAFAGVIVGNEALFNDYMTATQLGNELDQVRSNLTAKGIHLPVSTADLGDKLSANPSLATSSDIVMANVHPFFAGVVAADGANWAWTFWQGHDVPLKTDTTATIDGTSTKYPTNIISEIGWPSEGGHDCGGPANSSYGCVTDDDGSVANITNVNTFLDVWVCDALANGTMFFWFEAFDQPWQASFDTDDDHWESHWGLLDVNRNLKDGVTIPSCNGNTINSTYVLPQTPSRRRAPAKVLTAEAEQGRPRLSR